MLTGFLGLWLIGQIIIKKMKIKHSFIRLLVYSFILFIIPFLPQIVFEFRHNFVQTNSLIAYFQGENTSLGGVLPLDKRLTERIDKISGSLSYSLLPVPEIWQQWLILSIFFLLIIIFVRKYRPDQLTHYFLILISYFLSFHYLAYTFLFPAELKSWYLSGFSSLFILSISLIIEKIFTIRKLIAIPIVAAFMLWNTEIFTKLIAKNNQPAAPETLAAQLEVVDWIYQDALKTFEPFSVYTYTPPIYDYTYQYLIWWRGTKQYGKLPAEYRYLPNETDYLPYPDKFISQIWPPQDAKIAYLVINPPENQAFLAGWLGHFAAWPRISEISFPSGIKIETRSIIN